MKRLFILQLIFLLCANIIFSKVETIDPTVKESFSFAIVVDNLTFDRIENSILQYRDAIQDNDKLSVYVLVVSDEQPNIIRNQINSLYKSANLEGVVFIGDVPIPMVRGAQHMTSAFKMNENRDWTDSSVPSDRYYDDFDLEFKFLKRDSTNSLLYYYELTPESPQKIDKDIYSGRIKPPVTDDSKYDMIKNYLNKAVAAKNNPELLDNGFVYTGHGYHSESLISWRDEAIALREQFPLMFKIGGKLKHIRESLSSNMKEVIMMNLEKEKYDLAVFHAHGSDDVQYLMGYPAAESIQENVRSIRRFVRSKIRTAKERGRDIEELKNYYKENYNLTDEWFEGTFVDSVYKADSTFNYSMDIYSDDLELFSPQAEFMMFDQCFNGAFHVEDYITGRYLFGSGNVISAIAGSIGVLQDLWANKSLGLLGYGMSVGHWFDQNNYLEHHIYGDPTFHFKKTYEVDLNEKLREEKDNIEYWNSLLTASEPEVRALAVVMLYNLRGDEFIPKLIDIYKSDYSFNVRLHAFSLLAGTRSEEFNELLLTSINDPFEYIRRMSGKLMGEIGDDKYIPVMIHALIHDESSRVGFSTGRALGQMDNDKVEIEAEKYIAALPDFVDKERLNTKFERMINYNRRILYEEIIPVVQDDTLKLSKRLFYAKMLRNYNFKEAIDPMLKVISDDEIPEEIRIALIEAFGWYYFSEKRGEIIDVVDALITKSDIPESIRNEALKTKNRLITGNNVSLTP